MSAKIFKVQITHCSSFMYWYKDKIGKIYDVVDAGINFRLIDGSAKGIAQSDARTINTTDEEEDTLDTIVHQIRRRSMLLIKLKSEEQLLKEGWDYEGEYLVNKDKFELMPRMINYLGKWHTGISIYNKNCAIDGWQFPHQCVDEFAMLKEQLRQEINETEI